MSKRSASASSASEPPSKRATTLNAFFPSTSVPKLPFPIVSSSPITDRQSTFIAHACPITHESQASLFQAHIRSSRSSSHPIDCDHEILAWRTMSLKVGKNGLGGEDDWTVKTGGDDDGEKGGSREVQSAIQKEAAVDVAVVVSRLYGGVMLGPVRFQHMNKVATQALQRLSHAQTIPPLVDRLRSLDEEISQFTPKTNTKPTVARPEYEGMPLDKLERLTTAREKKLELLKKRFQADEEALWKEVEKQEQAQAGRGDSGNEEGKVEGDGEAEGQSVEVEEEIDEEEEALWAALEAQAVPSSNVAQGPTADELGLPSEEDAAVAAATLQVERKKREKEGSEKVEPVGMGGGFLIDE
ncbi:YigZ family protein [Sporobolomyces salmoneus]|uniref:YigZ family protein n=1 Tax=Sporobolomyces salmoneus TaxID=183962 RepID=UPI00316B95CD